MTSIQRELLERFPPDGWNRTIDNVILGFCEVFDMRPVVDAIDAQSASP
jgi:hypothetical protein